MNEKIKKFYYLSHKERNHYLIICLFKNMISIIESNFINKSIYIIFLLLNFIQSLSLSFEISYYDTTHLQIKKKLRYLHLCNYLSVDNINFSIYQLFSFLNIGIIILLIICFWSLSLKKPKIIQKVLLVITGFFLSLEKYFLICIHFSILVSPFAFTTNIYQEGINSKTQIILLKILNIIFIIFLYPLVYLISILFNDFSVYKKRIPWSSPVHYIDVAKKLFCFYLIFAGTFWKTLYLMNIIIINSFCGYIIYGRIKCPFYFHVGLNYFTIFTEGSFISFTSLYSILNIFWKNWRDYDIIFLLLLSCFIGLCYLVTIIFVDSIKIQNFNNKIEYFIITNKLSEYDLYIFLLRICDIIKKSAKEQKSLDLIMSFYTQHTMSCMNSNCHCKNINDLITIKNIMFKNESTDEEQGSLIEEKDIYDDSTKNEKIFIPDQNKIIKDKHLNLWGSLIKDIFETLDWDDNNYIKIEFANFLSFYLKKYVRSLIEISYISKKDISLHFQFYLYYSKILLIQSNKTLFESERDVSFYDVLEYNRYYDKFLRGIRETSKTSIEFWVELQKNIFQPEVVEKKGFFICKKATKIENLSKNILEKNPNDIRCLKIYGTFLCHILKLMDESKSLLDKAFLKLVMTTEEIETKTNKNYNFLEDMEVGVIVVNGNKESIGRIEYINYSFMNIFGYTKEEIIGRNVSVIMPLNIGKYHNQYIINFYTTSKPKLLNHIYQMIGLNKERLIIPVDLFIKILPCIEEGIAFIGLLKKTSFSKITKGPKHIRNNLGYIMTTDDGMLLHYNKVIEEKLQLNSSLMYNDTKDQSELFRIEMVFPELIDEEKLKNVKVEEIRLYFTNRIIEVLKRMEYSKVYAVLQKALNDFEEKKKKTTEDFDKRKVLMNSNPTLRNIKKTMKGTKNLISVSHNANNSEFMKKNTASVSVTHFSYSLNVKYMIFQIVFEKGAEQNITNIIKRYQKKFEEGKKSERSITQDIQFTNVLSIQSRHTENTSAKKGTILNVFSSARVNTFQQRSPKILKLITILNIANVCIVIIELLIEIILAYIFSNSATNSITLANTIQENFFHLKFLELSMYYYGLVMTNVISDTVSFNKTLHNELYYTYIIESLNHSVYLKDKILLQSKGDKETANMLTESTISFKTYYDESAYTITNQSLVGSIITIINYHNTILSIFKDNTSSISYLDIIADQKGKYVLTSNSDIEKNLVKSLLSIRENFDSAMREKYFKIINSLIDKHSQYYTDLKHIVTYLFLTSLSIIILYYCMYNVAYSYMNNVVTKILLLYADISLEASEQCLSEVKTYTKNIEKIIQDDIFFLSNYYNDSQTEQKYPNNTSTNSGLINNQNITTTDYNLGLEPEVDEMRQVFRKYNKKDMISIKDYLEDKKENEIQFGPLLMVNNNATHYSSSFHQKDSDRVNKGQMTFKKETDINNNNLKGSINNSSINIIENNNQSRANFDKDITSRRGSISLNPNINSKINNTTNLSKPTGPRIDKYKKKAIHKKSQIRKIKQYSIGQYPELYSIAFSIIFLVFISIAFSIIYKIINNSLNIFKIHRTALYYKLSLTELFPQISLGLINGEISKDYFDNNITETLSNARSYMNENYHFILRNAKKYDDVQLMQDILHESTYSCSYVVYLYEYGKESIFDFCITNYYSSGAELGDNEIINSALKQYNYIRTFDNLSDIETRKDLLNIESFVEGIDFDIFIVEVFYSRFLQEYTIYLEKKATNIKQFFLGKIGLGTVICIVIILVYLLFVRKKYLERIIYAKAMILLIPRSELIKENIYKKMKEID